MIDFAKLLKKIPKDKLNLVESEILKIIQDNSEVKKVGFKAIIFGNLVENKNVEFLEKEIEDIILSGELEEVCNSLDISVKLTEPIKDNISLMKDYEIKQLFKFLEEFLDCLGDRGCNDFDLKQMISNQNERFKFVKEYYEFNGDPENFDENNLNLQDFMVFSLLINKLKKELEQ
jgi:hypothetical protein